MTDNTFVFIIIAIVVAHFLFGIGYLIYKIMKAPKSSDNTNEQEEQNTSV
jgi:Na+-transporting methylmalonyl-CoA/oxaloacetate decarboxylase gamma subunit